MVTGLPVAVDPLPKFQDNVKGLRAVDELVNVTVAGKVQKLNWLAVKLTAGDG